MNKKELALTENNIEQEHQKVLDDEIYGKEYELIRNVLDTYRNNDNKAIVALKISLIDTTNSTNLNRYKRFISIDELADIILDLDFDKRVAKGDEKLVSDIANSNGKINLFSFASKYCCYHNSIVYGKDDYSIYDNVLKNNLPKYIKNISSSTIEKWRKEKDYKSYNECIGNYLREKDLKCEKIRRKFDHFVWNQFRSKKTN